MIFQVRELRKATADKRQIFTWIYEHSPSGAAAWLSAYDATVERLRIKAEKFAEAYENPDLDQDVRQALFRTRKGRIIVSCFSSKMTKSLSCGYVGLDKRPFCLLTSTSGHSSDGSLPVPTENVIGQSLEKTGRISESGSTAN